MLEMEGTMLVARLLPQQYTVLLHYIILPVLLVLVEGRRHRVGSDYHINLLSLPILVD